MRIWIDLANSPHVPFFAPLIHDLERRGHTALVTVRILAQTVELASLFGLDAKVIGVHGGHGTGSKVSAIMRRALDLRSAVRHESIDMAVSHNSYAQAVAARLLRIPLVTLMDYEHTPANHLSFRLARRVILPDVIPVRSVRKYGVTPSKYVPYPGFKEQVYLDDREMDPSVLERLGAVGGLGGRVLVVARPPADFAVYHRFKNPLFINWLRETISNTEVNVIVLPRNEAQRVELEALRASNMIVPREALDGRSLTYQADLVVSAGGTMNREAAVLGIPAYSLFKGRPAAVDLALEAMGRMTLIGDEDKLHAIRLEQKPTPQPLSNPHLKQHILEAILG